MFRFMATRGMKFYNLYRERSGSVVDCLTRDRGPRAQASPASLHCGP